jgi:hypothetical protein
VFFFSCPPLPTVFYFSLFFTLYFFTALDALPCPCPCPVSNFPFAARDRRRKLHRERAVFEFSFCCQGQEEEVTQGTFFPFAARDRKRKSSNEKVWVSGPGRTDRHQTDRHQNRPQNV